jgi:DNA-binding LytR/AlgR family response regulator
MTELATGASRNAGGMSQHKAGFVVATIGAVFMTVTEALGTGVVSFWPRLAYWVLVMETGAVLGVAVTMGVHGWGKFALWPLVEVALISVLIAVPLTLAVVGAGMIILGMSRPDLDGLLRNFALVTFVSSIITGLTYALGSRKKKEVPVQAVAVTPEATTKTVDDRFRLRLPLHLQSASILALVSEDHYLRVYTDAGNALILMRLSDAMAELDGQGGAQTHRSWWVARNAVRTISRGEGKAVLTLSDGTEAPVSRTHYRTLQAAGWFA